jgi:hypothetical protein
LPLRGNSKCKNKKALIISSRVSRDRRARSFFELAGTEEIRKVRGAMVSNDHTSYATVYAKVVVGNLGQRGGILGVEKDVMVRFLQLFRWRVGRVERDV